MLLQKISLATQRQRRNWLLDGVLFQVQAHPWPIWSGIWENAIELLTVTATVLWQSFSETQRANMTNTSHLSFIFLSHNNIALKSPGYSCWCHEFLVFFRFWWVVSEVSGMQRALVTECLCVYMCLKYFPTRLWLFFLVNNYISCEHARWSHFPHCPPVGFLVPSWQYQYHNSSAQLAPI